MIHTKTFRNVELLRVGHWAGSPRPIDVSPEYLQAIVDASHDPEIDLSPIKLGHEDDERFPHVEGDGMPAFGWVRNLHHDGTVLYGDIVGMPAKLAEIASHAYKRRSCELRFNVRTPSGKVHKATLSALALLGQKAPAVKGLSDMMALFGEEATPDPVWIETATTLGEAEDDDEPTEQGDNMSDDNTDTGKGQQTDTGKDTKLGEDADTVTISKAVLDQLRTQAEAGVKALEQVTAMRVGDAIATALSEGRIAPADTEKWTKRLTEDFDRESVRLGELAPGLRVNVTQRSDARLGAPNTDTITDEMLVAFLGDDYVPINKQKG